MNCIVCDKELRNVFNDEVNQPSRGLEFQSRGHYGSSVFDPMDGSIMIMNVCDDCLKLKIISCQVRILKD